MKISYDKRALNAAAEYIWNNNTVVRDWPDKPTSVKEVKHIIKTFMVEAALKNATYIKSVKNGKTRGKWVSWTGTGGYFFIFSTDDDVTIDVEILVSPNFKYKFVTKKLKVD